MRRSFYEAASFTDECREKATNAAANGISKFGVAWALIAIATELSLLRQLLETHPDIDSTWVACD